MICIFSYTAMSACLACTISRGIQMFCGYNPNSVPFSNYIGAIAKNTNDMVLFMLPYITIISIACDALAMIIGI